MALFRTKNHEEEEETETVTIPDFVEDKTTTSSKSIDMSIFKMSDEELYDDVETNDDEEDSSDSKKGNGALVFCIIMMIVLLACAGAAAFYAYKEHQNYVKAETDIRQLMAKETDYKSQIIEKDNLIASLNAQIEELKKAEPAGTKYIVVDGGMVFRTKPETDAPTTTYNGKSRAENDDILYVLGVTQDEYDSEMKWAKLADDIYVCVEAEGEVWAKEQ